MSRIRIPTASRAQQYFRPLTVPSFLQGLAKGQSVAIGKQIPNEDGAAYSLRRLFCPHAPRANIAFSGTAAAVALIEGGVAIYIEETPHGRC
jgi:hypothetical protein